MLLSDHDKNILPVDPHSWMCECVFGYDLLSSCAHRSLDVPTNPHQSSLKRGQTLPSLSPFFPLPSQVFVLAFTFLLLFLGNFLTTLKVVHTKLQKNKDKMKKL